METHIHKPRAADLPPIDIHNFSGRLPNELRKLDNDARILPANRRTLRRYVTLAGQGRLQKRGRGTPISTGRCMKLLTILKRFAMHIEVPFEQLDADALEMFILGIEDGSIPKLKAVHGSSRYSQETVHDFKKIIRTFYRWLLRDDPDLAEDLVGWFETRRLDLQPKALDPRVIPHLARSMASFQGDALVWTLFDGGFRIGELLNVRLGRDVLLHASPEGEPLMTIEIRVSKTFGRSVTLPLASDSLRFWVERHPCFLGYTEDGRVRTTDPTSCLFTWSYRYCCKRLREMGQRELGEAIHPHRFRHTSASYWAVKLQRHALCTRFGWSMGSSQPDRYIKRGGYFMEQVNKEAVKLSAEDAASGFARAGRTSVPVDTAQDLNAASQLVPHHVERTNRHTAEPDPPAVRHRTHPAPGQDDL